MANVFKFVVLYTTDESAEVLSRVFMTGAHARVFTGILSEMPNVQAYSTHRIGEKIGSMIRKPAAPYAELVVT